MDGPTHQNHQEVTPPDSESEFVAQQDFPIRVQEFIEEIGNNFPLPTNNQHHNDTQKPPIQYKQKPRPHNKKCKSPRNKIRRLLHNQRMHQHPFTGRARVTTHPAPN